MKTPWITLAVSNSLNFKIMLLVSTEMINSTFFELWNPSCLNRRILLLLLLLSLTYEMKVWYYWHILRSRVAVLWMKTVIKGGFAGNCQALCFVHRFYSQVQLDKFSLTGRFPVRFALTNLKMASSTTWPKSNEEKAQIFLTKIWFYQANSLWRRANARNISFPNLSRW